MHRTVHRKRVARRQKRTRTQVAPCTGVRDHAPVTLRPHTKKFSAEDRERLGVAVQRAREADPRYRNRPAFVKAFHLGLTSLVNLETGKPVGPSVYEAVARALPNWTEDTPVSILQGGPIPPTMSESSPRPAVSDADVERLAQLWTRVARMSYGETQDMAQYIRSISGEDAAKRFLRLAFEIQEQARREARERESETVSDHK